MTLYSKLPEETAKAFAAFTTYRDLGATRTLREAYCVYVGHDLGTKQVPGYFKDWAKRHDWQRRAGDFDAWLENVREQGAATALAEKSEVLAKRREALRERSLGVEERAVAVAEKIIAALNQMPMVRSVATKYETIKGECVAVRYDIYPAYGSLPLELKRIMDVATRSQPKADTRKEDEQGLGQSADDIEREFEQWLSDLLGEKSKDL